MICSNCRYTELVGIFVAGKTLKTTNNEECCLFGCPLCHTIMYTTDTDYITKRKDQYKSQMNDLK